MDHSAIELDNRAYEYVISRLTQGKELSQAILERVELRNGRIFTVLPTILADDKLYNFNTGGKVSSAESDSDKYQIKSIKDTYAFQLVANTDAILAELINSCLQYEDKAICIFEDATRLSRDPIIRKRTNEQLFPIVTLGETVYYYFVPQIDHDPHTLQKAIRISNSIWHFLCVIALGDLQADQNGEISIQALLEIVDNVQAIVIAAYDGESYLFWSKNADFLKFLSEVTSKFETINPG